MPPSLQTPTGLASVAGPYEALLCDVWGVVHDGRRAFPDAVEALKRFQIERGPVVLISNSPRPSAGVAAQLALLGVPADAYAAVATSGDVTRRLLAERRGERVLAIGPERDAPLYEGLDLVFADVETADFICCTGPVDDETETAEDYRPLLTRAAARRLLFICANPDRVVQRGETLIPCAGALAALYETLGGATVTAGKPFAPIYDLALRLAAEVRGAPPARERVLCVGDGALTDALGAARERLDLLFITSGVHAGESLSDARAVDAAAVEALLSSVGATARYALADLRW